MTIVSDSRWSSRATTRRDGSTTPGHRRGGLASRVVADTPEFGMSVSRSFTSSTPAGIVTHMSATLERVAYLVETAPEWAVELEIAPPTPQSVAHVRDILSLLPPRVADDVIRVFPSENAGLTLQSMTSGLRMVEVDGSRLLGTWVGDHDVASRYVIDTDSAAVAFLLAR